MLCSELKTCVILSWIHKQTHHFLMDTQNTLFSCHHSFFLSCNGYFIFLHREWRDIDSYTCLIHKSSHLFIMCPTDKRMVHLWHTDAFVCLFGLKTFGYMNDKSFVTDTCTCLLNWKCSFKCTVNLQHDKCSKSILINGWYISGIKACSYACMNQQHSDRHSDELVNLSGLKASRNANTEN